jgi:hypothetical protein
MRTTRVRAKDRRWALWIDIANNALPRFKWQPTSRFVQALEAWDLWRLVAKHREQFGAFLQAHHPRAPERWGESWVLRSAEADFVGMRARWEQMQHVVEELYDADPRRKRSQLRGVHPVRRRRVWG